LNDLKHQNTSRNELVMKKSIFNHCPICNTRKNETVHTLDCGNFDKSRLYPTIKLKNCLNCGHIFNGLFLNELDELSHYYNDEYAPTNLHAINLSGDRPGSENDQTIDRYSQLYNMLSPHIHEQHEILDVGCAMGGFLDFLYRKGFSRLYGVDMTETYVKHAQRSKIYKIKQGNAESLPFEDHIFDVVVLEQVMEHLANPATAFKEARRVLKNGGILYIGVPDASRYAEFYFFDFYWLLLREHIQHFDIDHLNVIAIQESFEMLGYWQTVNPVMSERMLMPNLNAIFRSIGSNVHNDITKPRGQKLKQQIMSYLATEKSRQSVKKSMIDKLVESRRPVYAWGIGREFLYLYESVGLKSCNIKGLIDINPLKQKSCSVDGVKIVNYDVLRDSSADSVLLITAVAHTDSIKLALMDLEFKGEIIEF
jgi:SAM-dependent methyltransferase